jgi:hypothetical protein
LFCSANGKVFERQSVVMPTRIGSILNIVKLLLTVFK